MNVTPGSMIHMDPRRPGRKLLAVWCWCGRFFTVTPEQAKRATQTGRNPCPSCASGPTEAVA